MLAVAPPPPAERQQLIAQARSALLCRGLLHTAQQSLEPWIVRSWQRCLANGHRPAQPLAFNTVSAPTVQRLATQHATLLRAARPVLAQLTRAIAGMRYFALLTDARGVVIDVQGAVDRNEPRARAIAVSASTCPRPPRAPPPSAPRWPSCSRCGCTGASISLTPTAATAAPVRPCSTPRASAWACST
jgi:hypothetical protein